jgi:hypothetical protein
MSINFCTIGSTSVDGFCGTQRAKVLARLIHQAGHDDDVVVVPVPPSVPPPGSFSPFSSRQQQMFTRRIEKDPIVVQRDQPTITVAAKIFGFKGSETLHVTPRLDFVTVTNLEFSADAPVIITDLEFNKGSTITVNISDMEI